VKLQGKEISGKGEKCFDASCGGERERRGLFSRYKERANNHMRESEKQGREGQRKGWIERENTD